MIYFDNASTSFPKPPSVARSVAAAIETLGSPGRGAYAPSLDAARTLYKCREAAAAFFNIQNPASAVFTSGATESLNAAVFGLLTRGCHVITTAAEHNAVLRPLYALDCALSFLPCDSRGNIIIEAAEKMLTPATAAVVCGHMSNVTGNITDLAYLSRFCGDNGLLLIADCAQSAGCVPVDASLADIVCFTGHKSLYGPQGTGGMLINNARVKPYKYGGTGRSAKARSQPCALPDRMEAGTPNVHSLAGLLAGFEFINTVTLPAIMEKEAALTRRFADGAAAVKKVTLYGDFSTRIRGPIVSFRVDGYDSAETADILAADYGIASRSGLHCAPLMHKALGTDAAGLVRFSFSYFNTPDEVDAALNALDML